MTEFLSDTYSTACVRRPRSRYTRLLWSFSNFPKLHWPLLSGKPDWLEWFSLEKLCCWCSYTRVKVCERLHIYIKNKTKTAEWKSAEDANPLKSFTILHHQPNSVISHGLNDERECSLGFMLVQVFTVCSSKVWPCRGFWCLQHVRSRRRSMWFTLTVMADPVATPHPITPVQNTKSGLWKSLRCQRKPEPGPTGKWPWITRPPSLLLQKNTDKCGIQKDE